MPLLGLVDPSHKEKRADRPGRPPRWLPPDELLSVAARSGPGWSSWPFELINAAVESVQDRDYISTTMVTGACARSAVIERREPFIETLDRLYAPLRGTLNHRTLEYAARPNSLAEARFFTTIKVPGLREVIEFSCSPDIITWHPDGLGDFKVTESPPDYSPWPNHKAQVNLNAYVVRRAERWTRNGEPFDLPFNPREWSPEELYLVYLGPKGPKVLTVTRSVEVDAKTTGGKKSARVPDIWDDETTEDYLLPRLKAMAQALASYPVWPFGTAGDTPGFEGPTEWACPGYPWCKLPLCLAKRYPNGLSWENE
jgi:hypothetical protein